VLVSPTSTATQLTQLGSSRKNYVYRTVPNNQVMGTDLARYALRRFRQIAIFYDSQSSHSNSFKKSLVKTFQQEGGRVVEEIDLTQGDGGVERVGTLKADAIALLPDPLSVELAIAVAKANRNRLPAIGSVSMYRFETLQQAGRELEGAVLPAPWHPLTSADPSFPQRANSLWGGDVNWRTALSFDTGRVLQALVQEGVTSRAGIADRLADSNFSAQGATGTIQFLPSGDRIGQPLLVRIQPGARSKTGFDFVPIQ
jgi:branched-chain amino acid transport system substrate-binding protein